MKPLGETRRHFWQAQNMARLHGLDLAAAVARGDLDQDGWSGIVRRCRGCGWTEDCDRFLERGKATGGLPASCRNREVFLTLLVDQVMGENI